MYPQDEQPQPPNQNLMGQAPEPFNYGRPVEPKKKRGVPLLVWIIGGGVLLLLVLIIAVVIASLSKDTKSPGSANNDTSNSSTSQPVVTNDCSSKQRRYQSRDLNIRFCYPTGWGDVKVADSKLDPSDSGTRYRISFADKASVHLGLVSDDWATDAAREGSCADPAVQAFPDTSAFSAKWVTQKAADGQISYALRGLEVVPDAYLLQEVIDNMLSAGVCLEGYKAIGGTLYRNAEATLYAQFAGKVTTPQAHITNPILLISVTDRTDFTEFVKSIEKY
jgi:hypothetical protein